jgi:hypothetical protein
VRPSAGTSVLIRGVLYEVTTVRPDTEDVGAMLILKRAGA